MATGQGSSFTFGTSGITLPVISIEPPEESIDDIAAPHLGLTVGDNIPYDPSDLQEGGEYSLTFENDRDTVIATRVKETCTWTKPINAGDTTAAKWVFTGYIKSVKENNYATGERATIAVVVKVASNVVKTAAA